MEMNGTNVTMLNSNMLNFDFNFDLQNFGLLILHVISYFITLQFLKHDTSYLARVLLKHFYLTFHVSDSIQQSCASVTFLHESCQKHSNPYKRNYDTCTIWKLERMRA